MQPFVAYATKGCTFFADSLRLRLRGEQLIEGGPKRRVGLTAHEHLRHSQDVPILAERAEHKGRSAINTQSFRSRDAQANAAAVTATGKTFAEFVCVEIQ